MKTPIKLALAAGTVLVLAGFGNGSWQVGRTRGKVTPATYTAPGGPNCKWARLGAGGRIIAQGIGRRPLRLVIPRTDVAFRTSGCGNWVMVFPPKPTTTTLKPTTTTTVPHPVNKSGHWCAITVSPTVVKAGGKVVATLASNRRDKSVLIQVLRPAANKQYGAGVSGRLNPAGGLVYEFTAQPGDYGTVQGFVDWQGNITTCEVAHYTVIG